MLVKAKRDNPHNIKHIIKIYFLLKVLIIVIDINEPIITPIKTNEPKSPNSESVNSK